MDAPYYVFSLSMEFKGGTFNDLADFIGLNGIPDGSCTTAFRECHRSRECRAKLDKVYTTCSRCTNREDCLKVIKVFTSSLSVQVRRPLIFCKCPNEEDKQCLFAKNILRPTCVRVRVNDIQTLRITTRWRICSLEVFNSKIKMQSNSYSTII